MEVLAQVGAAGGAGLHEVYVRDGQLLTRLRQKQKERGEWAVMW